MASRIWSCMTPSDAWMRRQIFSNPILIGIVINEILELSFGFKTAYAGEGQHDFNRSMRECAARHYSCSVITSLLFLMPRSECELICSQDQLGSRWHRRHMGFPCAHQQRKRFRSFGHDDEIGSDIDFKCILNNAMMEPSV